MHSANEHGLALDLRAGFGRHGGTVTWRADHCLVVRDPAAGVFEASWTGASWCSPWLAVIPLQKSGSHRQVRLAFWAWRQSPDAWRRLRVLCRHARPEGDPVEWPRG